MENQDVIVPMDFNPQTNYTSLEFAIDYCDEDGTIHVLTVSTNSSEKDFRSDILEEAQDMFDEFETKDRKLECVDVEEGPPSKAICEYANDIDANLIVMLTKGHEGFKRMVLGSTTGKTIQNSPCPVLTVKESD